MAIVDHFAPRPAEAPETGAPTGWRAAWAEFVRRGPSIVRRFRLGSGLVLFSYVFLHFLNHSLGNIGYEAMEWGGRIHEMIWRSQAGTVLLYGAFAIHFSLAFWAIYIAGICAWGGSRPFAWRSAY